MLDLRLAVSERAWGDAPVKVRCVNPLHSDPTNSLAVYPDNIHCYGCGFHRNDADEALALLLKVTKEEAQQLLPQFDSENLDAYRERAALEARKEPMPLARARMLNRFLWESRPERAEWYFKRGLTRETINEALLGHDGFRFSIPIFDKAGNLLSIRYRRDDAYCDEDIPKYAGTKGRNGLYVYGEHWLEGSSYVVITEGELDALRLHQSDVRACSATNGARQARRLPAMLHEMFPSLRKVYVATDSDEAGETAAIQTMEAAEAAGLEAIRLGFLVCKDVTEFLEEGFSLRHDTLKGRLINGAIRYRKASRTTDGEW